MSSLTNSSASWSSPAVRCPIASSARSTCEDSASSMKLAVDDAEDAQHHMSHFMEEAEPSQVDPAEEAMGHLTTGELHEAEELVRELIESMLHQHHHHD